MNKTALDLATSEWHNYNLVVKSVAQEDEKRWQQGWQCARSLASQLRQHFGATKIVVFGSLIKPERFDSYSDIDLAVWGIPASRFYQAVAMVTGSSQEFRVDLVDGENCSEHLKEILLSEGREI